MNLSLLLRAVRVAATLVPIAVQLVGAVESALPADTPGAAKLDAVKSALAAAADRVGVLTNEFDAAWPMLEGMIGSLVATFRQHKVLAGV